MRLLSDQEIRDAVIAATVAQGGSEQLSRIIIGALWRMEKLRREAVVPESPSPEEGKSDRG
jgi:hypothetical protein